MGYIERGTFLLFIFAVGFFVGVHLTEKETKVWQRYNETVSMYRELWVNSYEEVLKLRKQCGGKDSENFKIPEPSVGKDDDLTLKCEDNCVPVGDWLCWCSGGETELLPTPLPKLEQEFQAGQKTYPYRRIRM